MTSLEQHVHDALVGSGWTQGQPVVVGASGGLDSTVLLHVLSSLGVPSVVAHVNHHARGEASKVTPRSSRNLPNGLDGRLRNSTWRRKS